MENHDRETIEASTDHSRLSMERKLVLALGVAVVLVIAGMYAWKSAAVSAVNEKLDQVQVEQARARTQLVEQARQLVDRRSLEEMQRFCIPLAWAVRREVMANNLDQVDQYFTELVQQPGFKSAVLAKPDGKIVVASDRKHLADAFSSLYPAEYLQASDIKVEQTPGGNLRAIIPIMGLNQHLGTVVLEYASPAFTLH